MKSEKKRDYELRKRWLINPKDTKDDPLTYERLMNWLVNTGWVQGFLKKRLHPLDRPLEEDMLQECWVQILSVPPDKMLDIYNKGKGKFTNYLKSIIVNNICSVTSVTYKHTKGLYSNELYLTDEQWNRFEESDDSEVTLQFPGPNSSYYENYVEWVSETQHIHSENKLNEEYNYGEDI